MTVLAVTQPDVEVTDHALTRWRQRVGWLGVPIVVSVRRFVAGGKASKRPPRWLPRDDVGFSYVVNGAVPGVCAVLDPLGVVVTVVDRRTARALDRWHRGAGSIGRRKESA